MTYADDQSGDTEPQNKIDRIAVQRGLGNIGAELESHWTDDSDSGYSLRELADYFNQRVLQAAMEEAGHDPLEGEVENLYQLLYGEKTTSGMKVQARNRLQRIGIDIEKVDKGFVSHQTVHNYLKNYRDVEHTSTEPGHRAEKSRETIQRLKSRMKAVTESEFSSLQGHDDVNIGNFNVIVDTRIICEDCGGQFTANELLDSGGCDCNQDRN